MAVPTGTASMQDIENEFGGTGDIALSEYYGANSNIPASGTISIDDFRGESAGELITVTEGTYAEKTTSYHGYSSTIGGGFGSRSPTTFNGVTIESLHWTNFQTKFVCILQGIRSQSFFDSLDVEGIGNLTSAGVTNFSAPANTVWEWHSVSQGGWDGSGTRTVTFNY